MSSLKLYAFQGDFHALKCRIAAQYNGIAVDMPKFDRSKDATAKWFLEKNPLGKTPLLDTPDGAVFESNAIARYIARMRSDTELMGRSFFERALVDSWMDFAQQELEVAVTQWIYPIQGYLEYSADAEEQAEEDVAEALSVLNAHLKYRTFLVGDAVTLADICVVSALLYPMKFVLTEKVRAEYPHVMRWFLTCVNQPEIASVVGDVPLCAERMFAPGASAKGGKGKGKGKGGKGKGGGKQQGGGKGKGKGGGKGGKAKAAAPAPAPAPEKPVDPFAGVGKSNLNMEVFKRMVANAPNNLIRAKDPEDSDDEDEYKRDYAAVMPKFFAEMYDHAKDSVWIIKYKHQHENTVDFMTSNLVRGLTQRAEGARKYCFGVFHILKQPQGDDKFIFPIVGAVVLRGTSFDPFREVSVDIAEYDVERIDPADEAAKARFVSIFGGQAGDQVEGLESMDCKWLK